MAYCRFIGYAVAVGLAMTPEIALPQASVSPQGRIDLGGTSDLPTPVFSRPNPDYDPIGVHAGAFYGYPTLQLTQEFDDNVYALGTKPIGDFRTRLSPSLTLQSDWNRHALSFSTSADIFRYWRRVSENITDTQSTASARLDLTSEDTLNGAATYRLAHEDRGSPDAVNGKTPTRYQLMTGTGSYLKQAADFQVRVDSDINRYFYNNVQSSTGGTIDQTYRNRAEYTLSPQIGYQYLPQAYAYLKAAGSVRSYDAQRDPSGFDRSSDGYLIAAGTGTSPDAAISANIFVGYSRELYHDARLSNAGGVAFSADLLWNPTALTSVTLTAARTIEETTITTSSSAQQVALSAEVQHQFRDDLIARVRTDLVQRDYQGITGSDTSATIAGEVRYLVNPNISVAATYSFENRSTPAVAGVSFSRNVFGVSLTGKF